MWLWHSGSHRDANPRKSRRASPFIVSHAVDPSVLDASQGTRADSIRTPNCAIVMPPRLSAGVDRGTVSYESRDRNGNAIIAAKRPRGPRKDARSSALLHMARNRTRADTHASASQGTGTDYARSEGLRARIDGLVIDAAEAPIWIGRPSNQFVYRKSVQGGFAFVLVDAATLEKRPGVRSRPARDIHRFGGQTPGRPTITGKTLPLGRLAFVESGRAIEFTLTGRPGETVTDTTRWRCTLGDYACGRAPARPDSLRSRRQVGGGLFGTPPAPDDRPRVSPDGKLEALVQNYNVSFAPSAAANVTLLSTDGSEGDAYRPAVDRVVARLEEARRVSRAARATSASVHYVESSPDRSAPAEDTRVSTASRATCSTGSPVSSTSRRASRRVVDRTLFPNAYAITGLVWRKDSRAVHVRVQPARPPGLSRHRGRRATGQDARAHRRAEPRPSSTTSGQEAHRATTLGRRQGDHLDVGARRLEPPLPVRRRDRAGEEPDHEGRVGRPRRRPRRRRQAADLVPRRAA